MFDSLLIHYVEINKLKERPKGDRFSSIEIADMKKSLSYIGLINPVHVFNNEVISGRKRFRAYKELGYQRIPCYIHKTSEMTPAIELIDNFMQNSEYHNAKLIY